MKALSDSKTKHDGTNPPPTSPRPNVRPVPWGTSKKITIIIKEDD